VDASLRHKLTYPIHLEDMKKEFNFHEAPSKTSADEFLIATAKREKCFVVSNDTFDDWKKKDKWVKDRIDSIRVPFVITKEDTVILKGMEELREKVIEV
jgi:rRNA-processing protein FCF1